MNASSSHRPLLQAVAALLIAPFLLQAIGLTLTSSTDLVIYAMAAMGLNLLVGFTGLTSFGHGAWFGIGAYAAALAQLNWFKGSFVVPLLFAVGFVALLATAFGFLILRRRGVYFSLLTLALSALTFTVSFRWTALTGGESGLGGIVRPAIGPVNLDDPVVFLVLVSAIGLAVVFLLNRLLRSPVGHALVAIRENEQRATFQGYDTNRYKLLAFVVSATLTGMAGALLAFHHRFTSAEVTSVVFSGELLAMVVIGGMRSLLGPAIGALFYVLFREYLSIFTSNWLLYFGLLFVGFILFSPSGLIGAWAQLRRRWRPEAIEDAAMSGRRIIEGLPLPAFLRREQVAAGTPVLEVSGVARQFGGIRAVVEASLTLRSGEIHALIGPNGAGKTTAFNLVSGLFAPDKGGIRLHGQAIEGRSPDAICRMGLARSFQITNLFKGLSIAENLRLSVQAQHPGRFNCWRDVDSFTEVNEQTRQLLEFLGLLGIEKAEAGSLSYGGQRLVDLGIALGSHPRVLLMDEPLAGLAAAERERVSRLITTVAQGVPVLIVEHDIDRVLGFSQRVTVMNQGEVLMAGTPEQARADRRVQEVYTGTGTPPVTGRVANASTEGEMLLSFEGVDAFYGKSHILNRATLDVRRGEIVALLGRNGAGKSTLLKTLIGLVRPASGSVRLDGAEIAGLSAPEIARLGIGYVPQGRGLFAGMSVRDNLALGRLRRRDAQVGGVVWDEAKILEYFPRLRERLDTPADYLSGGEQQMVAVARALSGNVKLLLLDEPFEGLAPAVVQDLFTVFDRLRSEVSIIIVEHNLDLVLALADRVFALERGAVFHQGPAEPLLTDLEHRKRILWL
ncbi:MAG: ATP-binding cassette domain-containing protein [Betaproteobacteria bacterium]|nr:ATP-binding cassette domain-containing protein [Betaproteobacteria bacterium]